MLSLVTYNYNSDMKNIVNSIKLYSFFLHFLSTIFLIWTYPISVKNTLNYKYTLTEYNETKDQFIALISIAIFCLVLQLIYIIPYNKEKRIFLSYFITIPFDFCATFFNLWIAFDGEIWELYIFIFVFAVLFPTLLQSFHQLPKIFYLFISSLFYYIKKFLRILFHKNWLKFFAFLHDLIGNIIYYFYYYFLCCNFYKIPKDIKKYLNKRREEDN